MKSDCRRFRSLLAEVLEERAPLLELGWHEHLFACEDCRGLLAAEEALDTVLASLPEPSLPAELARRVLERLAPYRTASGGSDPLDPLLDLDAPPQVPDGLAERILAGLSSDRAVSRAGAVSLDGLLGAVPEPVAPKGLSERILAGLEPERSAHSAPRGRLLALRRAAVPVLLATAAVVAFVLYLGGRGGRVGVPDEGAREDRLARGPSTVPSPDPISPEEALHPTEPADPIDSDVTVAEADPDSEVPATVPEPDPELLESLDLLENWDLLASEDLDLLLDDLDETEALLLEYESTQSNPDEQSEEG